MTELETKLREILEQYQEECRNYNEYSAMEGNQTPDDFLISQLLFLIHEREKAKKQKLFDAICFELNGMMQLPNSPEYHGSDEVYQNKKLVYETFVRVKEMLNNNVKPMFELNYDPITQEWLDNKNQPLA